MAGTESVMRTIDAELNALQERLGTDYCPVRSRLQADPAASLPSGGRYRTRAGIPSTDYTKSRVPRLPDQNTLTSEKRSTEGSVRFSCAAAPNTPKWSLFSLRLHASDELLIRSRDVDESLLVGGIVDLIRHAARLLSPPTPMRRIIDWKWRVHKWLTSRAARSSAY